MELPLYFQEMTSPVGNLRIVADNRGLVSILWENQILQHQKGYKGLHKGDNLIIQKTIAQLKEYFDGKRMQFDIPLAWNGTPFQKDVWNALLSIPYGQTRTYGHIANKINNPKAVRAVGAANGKNPIPIIAPCHRVIGADGSLTGFAGGLANKTILLDIESTQASMPTH